MENFLFKGSQIPTIGVEIELQILDPLSLDLVPDSENILHLCKRAGLERVKAEMHQSVLEIDSEISFNVKECKQYLRNRLVKLNNIVESAGLQLAITGTHPFQIWTKRQISNVDRYQHMHKKFQWLIRRMNVYGLHVHVGVPTGDRALAISRGMVKYLPLLLALSANSPFWQGTDTGVQSSRISIMDSFPNAGAPPAFNSWQEFEYYYHTLLRSGAIHSMKDLYWHIRPNLHFGTIEFRVCDGMTTLWETMAVAALIHCLVVYISEKLDENPFTQLSSPESQWIAPHNQWVAARDGLDGLIALRPEEKQEKISDIVSGLIQKLDPIARKLNCLEELQDLHKIITRGNGAQRQRKIFEKTQSLEKVVSEMRQEFCAENIGQMIPI